MASEDVSLEGRTATLASVLREAIIAHGVTLAWLHDRLAAHGNAVSMATLSYWRSGARRPEGAQSIAALGDIEQLLALETGTLTRLLGPSQRTGPLGANLFPLDEVELENAVKDAYAALGTPYPDTSRELTTHSVTDVGLDGYVTSTITRSIVQSTVGTITAIPFVQLTPGLRTPPPIFHAVSGGRIAAHYSHPDGEVHGILFELEQPMHAPGTAMLEWSVELPPDYPPTRETGHAVGRQCRELLVWTRFHPEAVPDWVEELEESPHDEHVVPLSFEGRSSIHQVRRAFGPGALQLRWGYGPRE